MEWTINVMSAVLLTSISGTVVFLVWYTIGRILEYLGFINMVYDLLKAVLIFWFLPVSFIGLTIENQRFNGNSWGGFLFLYTPLMAKICTVLFVCWLLGVLIFIGRYIYEIVKTKRKYKNATPITDEGYEIFDQVCDELGLSAEHFDVVESIFTDIPMIFGLKTPTIVLPIKEFDAFEYRMIFTHELTHHKQKLILLDHLTALAFALNFWNLFAWRFRYKVHEWGESACDYDTIKYAGNVDTYYNVLLKIAVDEKFYLGIQAHLVERKGDLEKRILRMKRSYKIMNTKKKWTAAVTVAVMMVSNAVSVSAATINAGNTYMSLYNASVVEESHENAIDELVNESVLHHVEELDDGFVETEGAVQTMQGRRWGDLFEWDIRKNGSVRTPAFSVSSGQHISIMVTSTPSNATIHAGIINPDGSRDYVSGTSLLVYQFDCSTAGSYCVYVQNMSSGSVHVEGSYIVN